MVRFSQMKKTKAKTKFYEVEGKRISLPKGISVEMKNGIRKVTVTWSEHGKVRRKYFDYSLEGVEQAKDINATKKQELKRFGQEFGTISDLRWRLCEPQKTWWNTWKESSVLNSGMNQHGSLTRRISRTSD